LTQPRIAYYISSHGYGHAVRSAAVLKTLASNHSLFIKTEIPEEVFTHQEISCTVIPATVDTGCVQANFVNVDTVRSFRKLEEFLASQPARLEKEIQWLKENCIDLIVSDVSSFPLMAGKMLGIPRVLLANFTWHDIYTGFAEATQYPFQMNQLREEYSAASLQILPQCHVPNDVISNQEEVGFISLEGRSIRSQLSKDLNLDLGKSPVVFIYLGIYDSNQIQWENLGRMKDFVFLTRDRLPKDRIPSNLHIVSDEHLFPDLIASSDIVLTKPGYSTLATAFTHEKPVVTCTRENFKEYEVMKRFMQENQVGWIVPTEDFYAGKWEEDLKHAAQSTVIGKVRLNGAHEAGRLIESALHSPRD